MRVVQMKPFSDKPTGVIQQAGTMGEREKSIPLKFDIRNFKTDDWILLSIILTLILEGSEDYILLCALGYLFLMGLL